MNHNTLPAMLASAVLCFMGVSGGVSAQTPTAPAAAPMQSGPVVTTAEAKLRCGPGSVWYSSATLRAGTLLRVDGADGEWRRVAYPAGTPAVAKSEDAELRGGEVVLTRAAALQALDAADPYIESCYKPLLSEKLPVGTHLKLVKNITSRSGAVQGYAVEAPAGARGWVNSKEIKSVSDAEAARMSPPTAPIQASPTPAASAPATTTPVPAPTGVSPAPTNPAPTNPSPPPSTGLSTPAPQPAPGGVSPAPTTQGTPAPTTAAPPVVAPAPTGPTPEEIEAKKQADARAAKAKRIAEQQMSRAKRLKELDEAFSVVSHQPVGTAEVQPLISEYNKFGEELGTDPSTLRTRTYVQDRVKLLELRASLQDSARKMDDLRRQADDANRAVNSKLDWMQKTKDYLVVGKLVTSAMYDGQRLPRLYRLQSIDGDVGRTVAYIQPVEGMMLEAKLGMVVGIKGDGPYDPSAKVNIVTPTAVDVLKSTDSGAPAAPATPAPQPAAAGGGA